MRSSARFRRILLDVQMPDMNGFDTAQIIKSREKSRYIPIIFLSAISKEDSYVFKGYSMGAVDYVFKPFNPDVLRSKVAVFVDLYLKQQQIKEQAELLAESQRRELELQHRAELLEIRSEVSRAARGAQQSAAQEATRARAGDGGEKPLLRVDESRAATPINAVIGYSTLLIDNIYGPLNEKQREGLHRTLRGTAPSRAGERRARSVEDRSREDRAGTSAGERREPHRGSFRHRPAARGRARIASSRSSTL